MRFADLIPHMDRFADAQKAIDQAWREDPLAIERDRLAAEARRIYRFGQDPHDQGGWQIVFDGRACREVMRRGVDVDVAVGDQTNLYPDGSPRIPSLTVANLEIAAQIARHVVAWVKGEVDELAPSGPWAPPPPIVFPPGRFGCPFCGRLQKEWAAYCPSCGQAMVERFQTRLPDGRRMTSTRAVAAPADPGPGSHLIDGEFQSDKYPTCPRGKVPLSVKDPTAQDLLWAYAQRRRSVDAQFSADLETALATAGFPPPPAPRVDNERGTPYTVGEARIVVADAAHRIDPYHRELMAFLLATIDAAPVAPMTAPPPAAANLRRAIGDAYTAGWDARGDRMRDVAASGEHGSPKFETRCEEYAARAIRQTTAPTVTLDLTDPHCEGIEDSRGVLPMEIAGGAHPLTVDGEPGELQLRITRPDQPDRVVRYRRAPTISIATPDPAGVAIEYADHRVVAVHVDGAAWVHPHRWIGCANPSCDGAGRPGGPCSRCDETIPDPQAPAVAP